MEVSLQVFHQAARCAAPPWQPTGIAGVTSRRLHADPTRHAASALMHMAPGSSLPRQRHVSAEQFYMVEGEARVGYHHLGAGDYYRIEADTIHEVSETDGGCVLLLLSSRMQILA